MHGFSFSRHVYCEKNYLRTEIGTGGLMDPVGAEDVKRMGVENLAGGSTPTPFCQITP